MSELQVPFFATFVRVPRWRRLPKQVKYLGRFYERYLSKWETYIYLNVAIKSIDHS